MEKIPFRADQVGSLLRPARLKAARRALAQARIGRAELKEIEFALLAQFFLSPQCGFASTKEGNLLSEDEQWQKLKLVTAVAGSVWDENE